MIYLDHAATAHPRHPGVEEAMLGALHLAGSVGRGAHGGARAASQIVASCRQRLADLLGVADPQRMVLFPSSTLGLSTIIADLCRDPQPDAILWIGALEHNAVWRPAVRALGEERVRCLPVDAAGLVDLEALARMDPGPALGVVLQHASNVTGIIQPIEEVGAWCQQHSLPLVVDGAQSAGIVPLHLGRIDGLAAFTMAGHKHLGGPPGIGPCYLAPGYEPQPLWIGGNGVDSAHPTIPASGPGRYESGTPNLPGIAGLDAALNSFEEHPVAVRFEQLSQLREVWRQAIADIDGVELRGESRGEGRTDARTPVLALDFPGLPPEQAAAILEVSSGARCRAGLQCAPLAHRHIGTLDVGGTMRIAPGLESDEQQRDQVVEALRQIASGSGG
ncbi:MAG: aminotransferase class V-fold PLP-dependent enzyme [Planctomycetes bacterium]|nr:aminotransferase class V-fold PLP-dependent enzyme [Planctomycetota bacterium]